MSMALHHQRLVRVNEIIDEGVLPWRNMNTLKRARQRAQARDPSAFSWLTMEGPSGRSRCLWLDVAAAAGDLQRRGYLRHAERLQQLTREGARL